MKRLLLPISFLYSIVLFLRHKLYDWKILKSKSYNIPNICVGNLNLGGTGKTPHIEYLTNLLSENYKIAIVIGPEGGIDDKEAEKLREAGAKVVSLGKRILRTETVALQVSSIVMYELENGGN